jgi:hypothetical protein
MSRRRLARLAAPGAHRRRPEPTARVQVVNGQGDLAWRPGARRTRWNARCAARCQQLPVPTHRGHGTARQTATCTFLADPDGGESRGASTTCGPRPLAATALTPAYPNSTRPRPESRTNSVSYASVSSERSRSPVPARPAPGTWRHMGHAGVAWHPCESPCPVPASAQPGLAALAMQQQGEPSLLLHRAM